MNQKLYLLFVINIIGFLVSCNSKKEATFKKKNEIVFKNSILENTEYLKKVIEENQLTARLDDLKWKIYVNELTKNNMENPHIDSILFYDIVFYTDRKFNDKFHLLYKPNEAIELTLAYTKGNLNYQNCKNSNKFYFPRLIWFSICDSLGTDDLVFYSTHKDCVIDAHNEISSLTILKKEKKLRALLEARKSKNELIEINPWFKNELIKRGYIRASDFE